MIHNFWSFSYNVQRFKDKVEECGIEVEEVNKYKTSTLCPLCGVTGVRRYRGLSYCPNCRIGARDIVGVLT